jgi:hypothetical protein
MTKGEWMMYQGLMKCGIIGQKIIDLCIIAL